MRARILPCKGLIPLLFSLIIVLFLSGCAENSNILDNTQNRQLRFSVSTYGWNNSNSSSNSKSNSRATPITGNTFDTSKSFNIIADVSKVSNWSTEVKNETVSYSSTNNIWQTTAIHYWPGAASTVDFYAYYPTSISSKVTHATGSAPVLSYIVPNNAADQIDILASSKTGVAGDSYNQTPVDFKHIFAAVQFSVGSKGLGSGTISYISIGDVHNSGTYTFGNGWTLGTSTKTFTISQSKTISGTSGEDICSGIYTLMMIPQTVNNAMITVNYSNGGILTKAISGTWEAGETYNYRLSFIREYDYTGSIQTFTVPITGTYKLEVWGASGGGSVVTPHTQPSSGGPGGYSSGIMHLSNAQTLYIYIGGAGTYGTLKHGGWNGGGDSSTKPEGYSAGSGGGATDIRTVGGDYLNSTSLNSRLIVAGGGGGADNEGGVYNGSDDGSGGAGGGTSGQGSWIDGAYFSSYGGTQSSGYALGQGQNSILVDDSPGAGGGYYGGLVESSGGANSGAGGGSGYIGGVTDGQTIAGNSSMPAPSGGIEIGHSGNGYARITFVSAN